MDKSAEALNLKSFLERLIAKHDKVEISKVNIEYIRKQREQNIYPNQRFIIGSRLSHGNIGQYVLTGRQWLQIEKAVDKMLVLF